MHDNDVKYIYKYLNHVCDNNSTVDYEYNLNTLYFLLPKDENEILINRQKIWQGILCIDLVLQKYDTVLKLYDFFEKTKIGDLSLLHKNKYIDYFCIIATSNEYTYLIMMDIFMLKLYADYLFKNNYESYHPACPQKFHIYKTEDLDSWRCNALKIKDALHHKALSNRRIDYLYDELNKQGIDIKKLAKKYEYSGTLYYVIALSNTNTEKALQIINDYKYKKEKQ